MEFAKVCEGRDMTEHPTQLPEGALIADALKKARLSARKAAERAGLSEGRWRQIVKGYQTVSAGTHAPVRGPAETVARMASVVGVTPEQLEAAGRADAAAELRTQMAPASTSAARTSAVSAPTDVLAGLPDDPAERIPILQERIRALTEILETAQAEPSPDSAGRSGDALARVPGVLRDALRDREVRDWQILDVSEPDDESMILVMWVGALPTDDKMRDLRKVYGEHHRRLLSLEEVLVKRQEAWSALFRAKEAVQESQSGEGTGQNGEKED